MDKVPDQVAVEEDQQDTGQPEQQGDYIKRLNTEKLLLIG